MIIKNIQTAVLLEYFSNLWRNIEMALIYFKISLILTSGAATQRCCPELLCNFIEITLQHGCSLVNLLHISRTPFPENSSGELLL